MSEFLYELAHRGKIICPKCGRKTFVPYIDYQGNMLHPEVGKCDRADHCNYHMTPKAWFAEHPSPTAEKKVPIRRVCKPVSFVPFSAVKKSVSTTMQSGLFRFLISTFPLMQGRIMETFLKYLVGHDNYFEGAAVFWQIDRYGQVHTGKIMGYDPVTGHRIKEPRNQINWYHTAYPLRNFNLRQCLFGEHLLHNGDEPVIVVESEKTALVLSIVCKGILPVACGGCGNLSLKMLEPLRGRDIILLPDNGKYDDWQNKSLSLSGCSSVKTSDIMERIVCNEGDDIADLILDNPEASYIKNLIKSILYDN